MKNINLNLNNNLINRFFGGMDAECLEEIKALVEQGAVIDPVNGEIVLDNTRTGICTDYFTFAFYLDEDERPHQMEDANLCIASRMTGSNIDPCHYICIDKTPTGDLARSWDPNSQDCYGPECRVYQLRIEVEEGRWEVYPIWFEYRGDATIYFNE